MTSASIRLAIVRSGSFIVAIACCRSFLPSSLVFCALSSRAYSFIAARSSAENFPDDEFLGALVLLADVFFLVVVVFAGMACHLRVVVCVRMVRRSGQLLDAEQVAGRIAERAVADPVGLVGRLLDDLGVAGLQPLERAIEVLGGQVDAGEGALGHHLGDRAALFVGGAGRDGR